VSAEIADIPSDQVLTSSRIIGSLTAKLEQARPDYLRDSAKQLLIAFGAAINFKKELDEKGPHGIGQRAITYIRAFIEHAKVFLGNGTLLAIPELDNIEKLETQLNDSGNDWQQNLFNMLQNINDFIQQTIAYLDPENSFHFTPAAIKPNIAAFPFDKNVAYNQRSLEENLGLGGRGDLARRFAARKFAHGGQPVELLPKAVTVHFIDGSTRDLTLTQTSSGLEAGGGNPQVFVEDLNEVFQLEDREEHAIISAVIEGIEFK
jgi:hypothetical protein